MKSKKILFSVIIGMFSLLLLLIYYQYNINIDDKSKKAKHVILEGKTDGYETLDELENDSPIIIKGTKVNSESPKLIKNQEGYVISGYTLSNFKIDEIIKSESDNDLEVDDTILIIENDYYDDDSNTYYHVNGYKMMTDDKEYILLLHYSDSDGWFVPTAVTFGKVPIDNNESIIYSENNKEKSLEARIDLTLLKGIKEKYQ